MGLLSYSFEKGSLMRRSTIVWSYVAISYCSVVCAGSTNLYWTDNGANKIVRANLDGTNVIDIVTGTPGPNGIALDETHGKVYWTTRGTGGPSGTLQRANLDGSGQETVLTGLELPEGVGIDPVAGYAYFTERGDRGIYRAGLDGSGKVLLINTSDTQSNPLDLKLDLTAGKIYWADDAVDSVFVANLDGSNIQTLIHGGGGFDVGLDVASNHLYWTRYGAHEIRRANLDGTAQQLILSGLGESQGLALDLSGGSLYFAEFNTGKIRSAALDGSGLHDIYVGGVNPRSIAIGVPEPSTWCLVMSMLGSMLVWKTRRILSGH
jgi:DNA-binding beta-propeller fold protein YncE